MKKNMNLRVTVSLTHGRCPFKKTKVSPLVLCVIELARASRQVYEDMQDFLRSHQWCQALLFLLTPRHPNTHLLGKGGRGGPGWGSLLGNLFLIVVMIISTLYHHILLLHLLFHLFLSFYSLFVFWLLIKTTLFVSTDVPAFLAMFLSNASLTTIRPM